MDGKEGGRVAEQPGFDPAGLADAGDGGRARGGRPGPTWRAWVLSIVAAIVLSAAATLLLGGSYRLPGASNGAAGGCGAGAPCCPPPAEGGR